MINDFDWRYKDGEDSLVGLQEYSFCVQLTRLVFHLITEPTSDRSSHQPVPGRSTTYIWLNLTTLESKWLIEMDRNTCVSQMHG